MDFLMPAICAALAVVSYTAYARYYSPLLITATDDPLLPATILYFLSAIILATSVLITSLWLGFNFALPETLYLWGSVFTENNRVWVLVGTILLMSILYCMHIIYEAKSRQNYSISTYVIVFQINIVFIVLMDVVVNRIYLPVLPVIGGVLVLGSGIGAFINAKGLPDKSSNAIIRIAIISALSCGVALFIDGEISHYIIFKDDSLLSSLPVFLFYEMLTFGIPSLLAFLLVLYKLRKRALQALKAEFIEFPTAYWLSALFSVGQFVFSVFALSYSNDRVLTAAILGTAPLLGVLTDKKQRTISQKRYDILFSFITLIGIILATAYAFL